MTAVIAAVRQQTTGRGKEPKCIIHEHSYMNQTIGAAIQPNTPQQNLTTLSALPRWKHGDCGAVTHVILLTNTECLATASSLSLSLSALTSSPAIGHCGSACAEPGQHDHSAPATRALSPESPAQTNKYAASRLWRASELPACQCGSISEGQSTSTSTTTPEHSPDG